MISSRYLNLESDIIFAPVMMKYHGSVDLDILLRALLHFATLWTAFLPSNTFFNYVVWESAKDFKQAFNRPEFRSRMADVLPNAVMSPHLFKKVAVSGICVE